MSQKERIAALLHEFDERSPAGFAIALHVRFTRPTFLFQTYPKRWMDHYSAAGLVMHDPTVRWGLSNAGHIRWSELEDFDPRGVLEQAKDYGIMNGVAISVVTAGSRSIASFARADRDFSDAEVAELEVRLSPLHAETENLGRLSERDRQALVELSVRLTH
ncbi:MAG: autoinducer binding domain-containing protein [Amaricoccus sp.]